MQDPDSQFKNEKLDPDQQLKDCLDQQDCIQVWENRVVDPGPGGSRIICVFGSGSVVKPRIQMQNKSVFLAFNDLKICGDFLEFNNGYVGCLKVLVQWENAQV